MASQPKSPKKSKDSALRSQASLFSPEHSLSLGELFQRAGLSLPSGVPATTLLCGFSDDSREVTDGSGFIAALGETVDGHRFISTALANGAAAVIAERVPEGVARDKVVVLENTRHALPLLAHAWWGNPSRKMKVVGITGTNGKTTTAYLVETLLRTTGGNPALFGTVEYRFGQTHEPAPTTTPGAFHLARLLAAFRARGADSVVMEVSSHALVQGRVEGVEFDVALITNVTQDHLDYHRTMEEYAEAKRLLFTKHKPKWAVFNLDDPTAARFAREYRKRKLTYSLDRNAGADLYPLSLDVEPDGIRMDVRFPAREESRARRMVASEVVPLESPLRGRFNASNLLAAAAIGVALGFEPARIVQGISQMRGAPGRFELVETGRPFSVYVDYAHTPDAVERVLENVRLITRGKVIVVLGCGGDRDPTKRPKMGAAMGRLADFSIITNDNPRTEDPAKIAAAMEEGIRETKGRDAYEVHLDRREAIERAIELAQPDDSVLIAGKGHEDYQIVGKEKRHFDDREIVMEVCSRS
jgi:UDP-N-acetylmuramoyl-L-alanyl-D-glutamate--2,6-diaminopimelate ligase